MNNYTIEENTAIQKAYENMLADIKPHVNDKGQLQLIQEAYTYALEKYDGKHLVSGKAYLFHLIDLARIAVIEVGLGYVSVICAFLHGITYKRGVQLQEIESRFGKIVAIIIDGFDKVSDIETEKIAYNSDSFRVLFLSLIEDMRVVLLKVVHRLYDIRNQDDINTGRLKRYVHEIKHLYIPTVHRLGLYAIKAEFEEKVMLYENPVAYREIGSKIKASQEKQRQTAEAFLEPIIKGLDAERERSKKGDKYKFSYAIKWRLKSIPSIYAKMKAQNVPFEQVYDLYAARIILDCSLKDEKECCWLVYSVITNLYEPNLNRLRDWITIPKASGYESLHCTVNFDGKRWFEIQIRTERMDNIAEKGQAAHYIYKSKDSKPDSEAWLLKVREILENPQQMLFQSSYHNTYKSDKIFIFTPQGDLKQLPIGSTVLDFAYEIHSKLGDTCNGARVNGRVVPIRYVLNNGDRVEIITSKKQSPRTDWLNFVTTDKAKNKIRRFLKEEEMREAGVGKGTLQRRLKNWKLPDNEEIITMLVKEYKLENSLQLYNKIALEEIELSDIKKFLTEELAEKDEKPEKQDKEVVETFQKSNVEAGDECLSIGEDISNVNYKLAKCCNPIPGEPVFGFVTTEGNMTIHRINCPNAKSLRERYGYRIIKVKWNGMEDGMPCATIRIMGEDVMGLLGKITKVISDDLKVNMKHIALNSYKEGLFDGKIVVQVLDMETLDHLMVKLKAIEGVTEVIRLDD